MSAAKNDLHQEQSIGKTVYDLFASILTGKSTPSSTPRRQGERNQTKRHDNKHRQHRHHHHHHHHHRHGPHEFDREETQSSEYPLNCEVSADAGFWEKAHNLQAEAVLRRPPQVTVRSSNRLLADLNGGIDALAPRKTSTTSGNHCRRHHREHHTSTQIGDSVPKPPKATARRGKDGVIEKRTDIEVQRPPPAAHKMKARISPKADRRDPVQDIHHTLRNREVTVPSQPRANPSRSECNQNHTLHVKSTRDKASVNLGNVPTRNEALQKYTTATSTLVESTMSNLSSSAIKESYLQDIPPRQHVLRHQDVQIMHPPWREGWPHSQEATIISVGMSDRDSVQTHLSDFLPKPLKIKSNRTVGKSVQNVSSHSEPSTPAVIPSPRPKATWLLGIVDDDPNQESRSSSTRTPPLNQPIYRSPQFNLNSTTRPNRGSAPELYWEDSFQIRASPNKAWPSSIDYTQESQQFCRICHKPCVQDRRIREVDHILCATCEARAFIQPYPTIANMVDHPGSRVGSPGSFDRPRRPSGGSTPGGRIRGRDVPTSPTLHEGEELLMPPPVPLKTGNQRPRLKDVGSANFPRGCQVMPLTPPSSSGSSRLPFKDVGSFPQYRTPRVVPPTSPSPSPPMFQIPRQGDNPNFPRGCRIKSPIPLAPSERPVPMSKHSSTRSATLNNNNNNNNNTTTSSIAQKTNRLQPHDNNHLASSSRKNLSSRPSMADSYITCTNNDYEIPKFIPFILDDDVPVGLGIDFGDGDEQQAAARSPHTPSSPMANRERNLVGRYQNKWSLAYSPSVTANEDQNESLNRPSWYYKHYSQLLGNHHHPGGDSAGGGGGGGDKDDEDDDNDEDKEEDDDDDRRKRRRRRRKKI